MPIIYCKSCGKKNRAPESAIGRKGKCAQCSTVMTIPYVDDPEPIVDMVAVESIDSLATASSTSETERFSQFFDASNGDGSQKAFTAFLKMQLLVPEFLETKNALLENERRNFELAYAAFILWNIQFFVRKRRSLEFVNKLIHVIAQNLISCSTDSENFQCICDAVFDVLPHGLTATGSLGIPMPWVHIATACNARDDPKNR